MSVAEQSEEKETNLNSGVDNVLSNQSLVLLVYGEGTVDGDRRQLKNQISFTFHFQTVQSNITMFV